MTNQELIAAYTGLQRFQEMEKQNYERTGNKILSGKIQLAYAINKNKEMIRQAIKPYVETKNAMIEEHRNTKTEQTAWKAEQDAARMENRPMDPVQMVFRSGKSQEEYQDKLAELENLETDFYPKKVSLDQFEGLDLSSEDLEPFTFMIEE